MINNIIKTDFEELANFIAQELKMGGKYTTSVLREGDTYTVRVEALLSEREVERLQTLARGIRIGWFCPKPLNDPDYNPFI